MSRDTASSYNPKLYFLNRSIGGKSWHRYDTRISPVRYWLIRILNIFTKKYDVWKGYHVLYERGD